MTRNCLLPIFLWIWLIASLISTAIAVAGVFDLPFYHNNVPDMPIPPWGPEAYAVTFFSFFISIIAILSEKDWGLPLFVAATVAVVAIQLFSGIPVKETIYILTNVVVLVVLLALDEWGETEDKDLKKIHAEGLKVEPQKPGEALKIYRIFEERNITRSLLQLFVSILSLPLAYVITFYVNQRIDNYQSTVAIVLMCLLGVGPIVFLSARRLKDQTRQVGIRQARIFQDEPKALGIIAGIWGWGWMLILALFSDAFQVLIMALVAGIIIIILFLPYNLWLMTTTEQPFVLGFPSEMPVQNANALSILIFAVVFIVVASEVRLKPFSLGRILREIPYGLRENWDKTFSFVNNVALAVVLFGFVSVQYDVIYEDITIGIIIYAFLGSLIGWDMYRLKKNFLLGTLNTVGQVRCLVRMGKQTHGRVKLQRAFEDIERQPEPYKKMASALSIHLWGIFKPEFARREWRKGKEALNEWDTPYHDLCERGLLYTGDILA